MNHCGAEHANSLTPTAQSTVLCREIERCIGCDQAVEHRGGFQGVSRQTLAVFRGCGQKHGSPTTLKSSQWIAWIEQVGLAANEKRLSSKDHCLAAHRNPGGPLRLEFASPNVNVIVVSPGFLLGRDLACEQFVAFLARVEMCVSTRRTLFFTTGVLNPGLPIAAYVERTRLSLKCRISST